MSYSTLKKALQLFEDSVSEKKKNIKKSSYIISKSKRKIQRAKNIFKVPEVIKSNANKSIKEIQEKIRNEKELNLVQINLERLNKLDRTSCINSTASKLIEQRYKSPSASLSKKEQSVFTDEDFEKFEREYFQN
ncbi:active regulator of SIRT1 isoform X2 [Daktulosphaira vitifoliae]|uniref:active regulator of SIRT1 isoform X2 n=1 Tax=Daktulosphaira vitifoliae TaxID=58002 RepID=UPI0021A9A89D|nr:active regulator of SIRT1 isoform X2 [Daktulosphaira vitifoliae]